MYSTFEFYKDKHRGKLDEAAYTAHVVEASRRIDMRTFGKAAKVANADMLKNLAHCECALIDTLQLFNSLPTGAAAISSVNNDGYSVSFASGNSSGGQADPKEELIETLYRLWLTHPQNLLFAGGFRCV